MTLPAPTFSQIRAQVRVIRKKLPDARVIGMRVPGRWTGERVKHDGPEVYCIEQCDSPLQARLALQEETEGTTTKVLVTNLTDQELGDDVLVRLAKGRLFPIDDWQIVKTLFQAQAIDPRLRKQGWIAECLLELVPTEGYPPAPGGFLDAEIVWPILLERLIGLTGERPDLPSILRWSISGQNVERFREAPEEFRRAASDWLVQLAGPAVTAVFRGVLTTDRPDALAVGLALGVVYHPKASGRLDKAAGRMERYLGGATPEDGMLQRWHAAAAEVVKLQLHTEPRLKHQQLARADEILCEVQAESFAYLSDTSPLGFSQRLARFGSALRELLTAGQVKSLESLLEARRAIQQHEQFRTEGRRLLRVDMALRLARWLALQTGVPAAPPRSLAEASAEYLAEGSYLDWARLSLRGGEPVRELSEGYARLWDRVTTAREEQNRRFGELLRDATEAGSTAADLIPVERILEDIVAPLAGESSVLLIVLDGMSAAVARELVTDLTRQDWILLREETRTSPSPGLAAIPSVTEVARTSLLCGRFAQGAANDEVHGFAAHPVLLKYSRNGYPPVLFHKVALQEAADASLAATVRKEIASSHRRIVGVVINAIDDHLLKGEQLDIRWTRDEIKVLAPLLYEARSARRIVVLVSDHGHVLDHQTQARDAEGGERWRVDDGHPHPDELAIRGERVVMPEGHRLIAPWSEKVRYGSKKNGYHGGLTPQEMVIPITVLATDDTKPAGWAETPLRTPVWWDEPLIERKSVEEILPLKPIPPRHRESLFDHVEEEEQPSVAPPPKAPVVSSWLEALVKSPVLAEQKKLGGRSVPADELLIKLLSFLDEYGGKMTSSALARRLDAPPFRLRGLLAVVQRLLNVDGYAVLTRDEASDTVALNRELLCRQFDLI